VADRVPPANLSGTPGRRKPTLCRMNDETANSSVGFEFILMSETADKLGEGGSQNRHGIIPFSVHLDDAQFSFGRRFALGGRHVQSKAGHGRWVLHSAPGGRTLG
jgi:hypothetical protein